MSMLAGQVVYTTREWGTSRDFQKFDLHSNDNKNAEYTCFRYKNMLNKVFQYTGFW